MCSGCSGYFEDGEDREHEESELLERDIETSRGSIGGLRQSWAERSGSAGSPAADVEDYEVLVSAKRIVERRVIRVN